MKTTFGYLLAGLFVAAAPGRAAAQAQPVDYSQCLVKTSTVYGTACAQCPVQENTLRVYITNQCKDSLEVKLAMKEEDTKRIRIFKSLSLAPKDSMSGYTCNGNARFFYWARKVGDQSIVLPQDAEIKSFYGK